MTRLRPIAALLLLATFLQANLLGAGVLCAAGAMSRIATASGHAGDHGIAEHHDATPSPVTAEQQSSGRDGRDTSHAPMHCTMAATCSLVASAGAAPALEASIVSEVHVEWTRADAPPSVGTAPEPPPPRA